MEDKLRAYMDHLFREVKPTKKSVELKEEILQNLIDKYHDMLAEGKTPEAAYNIAVASVGDTDELLEGLRMGENGEQRTSGEEIERSKRRSAVFVSVAMMLYITSLIPPILMSGTHLEDRVAPALMFSMIAAGTGILIFNYMTKPHYHKVDDTIVEEFKEWQYQNESDRRAMKAISSALWALITVIYILVSFSTMAWHITWVIFLIGGAAEGIIKAVFELRK